MEVDKGKDMDSKERFSSRVEQYVQYRPSYPVAAIDYLMNEVGVRPGTAVADIGAGTGIFTKLLLERGARVTAVEPNQAMREAAMLTLGKNPNLQVVAAAAEDTGLPEQSVDFIVCAQAFHWFDRVKAQEEFKRILRPGGKVVLIWNSRLSEGTPFLTGYEQLLHTYATDYNAVNHRNLDEQALASFFASGSMRVARFPHQQLLNYEGLSGRLQSSSYAPVQGEPSYDEMMAELKFLFERNQQEGRVDFAYETELYWGEL